MRKKFATLLLTLCMTAFVGGHVYAAGTDEIRLACTGVELDNFGNPARHYNFNVLFNTRAKTFKMKVEAARDREEVNYPQAPYYDPKGYKDQVWSMDVTDLAIKLKVSVSRDMSRGEHWGQDLVT